MKKNYVFFSTKKVYLRYDKSKVYDLNGLFQCASVVKQEKEIKEKFALLYVIKM